MPSHGNEYQPVANEDLEDGRPANGHEADSSSPPPPEPLPQPRGLARFLNFFHLDTANPSWHTFTTFVYGWPIPPHDPARETAWLDGLRGLAAFLVMSYHFNLNWFFPATVEEPWGSNLAAHAWDLWRLPFLRLWMCSGHTQVSIFFVLSGFVLSWSPLASIRAKNHTKLYTSLSSSAFRRWIRLYLPTVPVAFFECLELWIDERSIGMKDRHDSFLAQMWDFLTSVEKYVNPFNINRGGFDAVHPYDWTMWTIPHEFAGSLLVFFILLAVGRIERYSHRTLAIGIVVAYCAARAEWRYWLFSNGILIADYVKEKGGFAALSAQQTVRSLSIWTGIFIFALYLAGVPEPKDTFFTRPGYYWLDHLVPANWKEVEDGGRLWWNVSGILIVLSACHLSKIRTFFELPHLRYLGRISYMMYLTHRVVLEPALTGARRGLITAFGRGGYIDEPSENRSPWHWIVTIALYAALWVMHGSAAFCVAHWCERWFDAPSVKLARWLDDKFLKGWGGAPAKKVEQEGEQRTEGRLPQPATAASAAADPPAVLPYRD